MERLTHLDLFSGIGGFALACQWTGIETIGFVEIDHFCQKVLRKHWPNVLLKGDIRDVTGSTFERPITLVTGGFPCQPFSKAGKRRGRRDDRYLWPEMLRVVKEYKPPWVIGENVAGIESMDERGSLLEVGSESVAAKESYLPSVLCRICHDFEDIGYEVQVLLIPACSVGAWHQRDRIWIVAHANNDQHLVEGESGQWRQPQQFLRVLVPTLLAWEHPANFMRTYDGVSSEMDGHRVEALGNAIVPHVVHEIVKGIAELERRKHGNKIVATQLDFSVLGMSCSVPSGHL